MGTSFLRVLALAAVVLGMHGCSAYRFRTNYSTANALIHDTVNIRTKPFLKAHLKNGDVCILTDAWSVDTTLNTLRATGSRYDYTRTRIDSGSVSIPLDSVVIFETNKKLDGTENGRVAAMTIMGLLNAGIGLVCLSNPKACFGSCPTFYLNPDDDFHRADAEGFSDAVSPSLAYHDIDALGLRHTADGTIGVTMKNEALETHCVDDVNLMVYPVEPNERVFHSGLDTFYLCTDFLSPTTASADEGDVTDLLRYPDRNERFSLADSTDLKSTEEIHMRFDGVDPTNDLGLVLHFRQTLMTTYFVYSAMGYMGDEVGDVIAKLETDGMLKDAWRNGLRKELGDIDVSVWDAQEQQWRAQGGVYETGPIATNRQIVPLKGFAKDSVIRIKLTLNKGLWRIDHVSLVGIIKNVTPLSIAPTTVSTKGTRDDRALACLRSSGTPLLSMPGSDYRMTFHLPDGPGNYEVFLDASGYYLEWMREHWLKDKDMTKLAIMVGNARSYLRQEAGPYKTYEATMEQEFWNSRIDTKRVSYEEK